VAQPVLEDDKEDSARARVDLCAKAELCNRTKPNLYNLQRVFDNQKVRLG
jgi:hypothetical protein